MAHGTGYTRSADAPRTFAAWIHERGIAGGDKVALEICDERRTYHQLDQHSDRVGAGFAGLGLMPGEHVSLMMANSIENVESWFGLSKAGLVEVPIHTASRGTALEYIVHHADSRAIVIDEEFVPHLATIAGRLPNLQHVIINGNPSSPTSDVVSLPSRLTTHDLRSVISDGAPPRLDQSRRDTCVILHSSGTTGPPKGVVLSHEAVLHLTRHLVWLMDYTADDRLYTTFPLFHNNAKYTSVCAAMECGGSLVMERKFSASGFWDTCRTKGITAFNYMGALLMMMHKQPEQPDDADNPVRIAFGAPCPVEIWEPFEERFGVKLVEVYGMTEAPMACENRLDDRRIGSAGKESMTYEVMIGDENDDPVPVNEPGEILVRPKESWSLFTEYYHQPQATVEAWRNLWFHTGDRGRMDEDGFVFFIDRTKDCIRRRGENISSWEIESCINTHPEVLESAAYGVSSDLSESDVMVVVVLRPDSDLDGRALLDFCHGKIAHFAIPRYVRFMDELPKNHAERVQKFHLRDEGITTDTWDRDAHGYSLRR
jgi:crotonobetaine/carnitine-CoA ligase